MKLSKTQSELLEAMKNGVECVYVPYRGWFNPNAYYYRTDNQKRCTAAATALRNKGMVEVYDSDWHGHRLKFKAEEPA